MPDKRIDQLPDVSTLADDGSVRLMLFGNHSTGKLYKGVFSIDNNWKTLFSTSLDTSTVPASTTEYGQITGRAASFAVESDVSFIISEDCSIKNLFIKTDTAQPGTGNFVITLRVNGASTALSITIAAGAGAGVYSNTTDEVVITAGDVICYQYTNNASAASADRVSTGISVTKSSV